jgi:hypothetical protein
MFSRIYLNTTLLTIEAAASLRNNVFRSKMCSKRKNQETVSTSDVGQKAFSPKINSSITYYFRTSIAK